MCLAFVAAEVMFQTQQSATEIHGYRRAGGIGHDTGYPGLAQECLLDGIAQHVRGSR